MASSSTRMMMLLVLAMMMKKKKSYVAFVVNITRGYIHGAKYVCSYD